MKVKTWLIIYVLIMYRGIIIHIYITSYDVVQRSDVPDTASVSFYINLQQGTSIG